MRSLAGATELLCKKVISGEPKLFVIAIVHLHGFDFNLMVAPKSPQVSTQGACPNKSCFSSSAFSRDFSLSVRKLGLGCASAHLALLTILLVRPIHCIEFVSILIIFSESSLFFFFLNTIDKTHLIYGRGLIK